MSEMVLKLAIPLQNDLEVLVIFYCYLKYNKN